MPRKVLDVRKECVRLSCQRQTKSPLGLSVGGLFAYRHAPERLTSRTPWNKSSAYVSDTHYKSEIFKSVILSVLYHIRHFNVNLPVGKKDFNKKMREKLSIFIDRLKSGDYKFESMDFRELNTDDWSEKTFVYADPPYLITCATYNEQDGWNEDLEKELLSYLDKLNDRRIRFALSNVLRSKGKENTILMDWINRNIGKYHVLTNKNNLFYKKIVT